MTLPVPLKPSYGRRMVDDYDRSIHSNPDAEAWAEFFMRSMKQQGLEVEHIPKDLMVAWFANAMMAMHDHLKNRWVGLTDEEITELLCNYLTSQFQSFARAIEVKLKEKNT